MTKISGSKVLQTRILPGFFLGFVALMLTITLLIGGPNQVWWFVGIGFVVLIGLCEYLIFIRPSVDEVYDAGDHLLFRKNDLEQKVMLSNIADLEFRSSIIVHCREEGPIGSELIFYPPFEFRIFSLPPKVRDLLGRIEVAKSETVKT